MNRKKLSSIVCLHAPSIRAVVAGVLAAIARLLARTSRQLPPMPS